MKTGTRKIMVSDTLEKKEKKYNQIPNVMHLKKQLL